MFAGKKHLLFFLLLSFITTLVDQGFTEVNFEFHGNMLQTFGVTNNSESIAGKHKSGPTDFFSYDGKLNNNGDKGDYDFFNSVGTTFGLSKARLRFEALTDDQKAKFVYGLEVGTVNWGDKDDDKKFGLSGDGITQETRFAYAQFQIPEMSKDHFIRAGLQDTKINHWVWTETAAGLTYHGKKDDFSWFLGWYRGDEERDSNSNDNDFFVIKTSKKFNNIIDNIEFFTVIEDAGNEETSQNHKYDANYYYVGLSASFKSDILFGNFEWIYQGGDIDFIDKSLNDMERNAYLTNFTLGAKINKKLKLQFNSLYVSGDDNPYDLDASNFDSIDVDVKLGMIIFKDSHLSSCDRFVMDGPYLLDKGLIHNAIEIDYKINDKHKLYSAIRHFMTSKDIRINENSIGTEFDFKYAYKYNKYLKLKYEFACLFPDSAADLMTNDGEKADTILNMILGLQFKF